MEKISIEEILIILDNVIKNKISREDASNRAYNLRNLADKNMLEYSPQSLESIIWEAILFIEGIDLQEEQGVYLHNLEDISNYLIFIKNKSC